MAEIIRIKFGKVGQEEKSKFFNRLRVGGLIYQSSGPEIPMDCIDEHLISSFFEKCYKSNGRVADISNFFTGSFNGTPVTIGVSQEFLDRAIG